MSKKSDAMKANVFWGIGGILQSIFPGRPLPAHMRRPVKEPDKRKNAESEALT